MTQKLIEMIDLDMAYVRSESLKVLGNIVRVFPSLRAHLLPNLSRYLRKVEDPDARSVIVWMLGEFGQEVVEAPYILEPVIDNYNEESNVNLKLQMLSSTMKLFYKRPPEMQAMLGRLLSSAVNDNSNQDVHDKALLYYRLLMSDVDSSGKLFTPANTDALQNRIASGGNFAEDSNEALLDELFKEFNTLAVIYGKPSKEFIKDTYLLVRQDDSAKRNARLQAATSAVQHGLEDLSVSTQSTPAVSSTQETVNLLDFGDDNVPTTTSTAATQQTEALSLDSSFVTSPAEFQQQWGSFTEAHVNNNNLLCCLAALPDEASEVEESMASVNVSWHL